MALQHLRSSTADKRPTPGAMSDGQLAMNTQTDSPGLFFKDSNGDLVKVGPVHVGATAPNASPAVGGQSGNSTGEQWLDTSGTNPVLKIWDGSAWQSEAGEFVNVSGDTMTGALGIIAGSQGSPSLFISGDTDTGLYSPGANEVAISTNGTGRLFIDSSGNVGIGTTSPSYLLDVSSASSTDIRINAATGQDARLRFSENESIAFTLYHDASESDLVLYDNSANSERLRINSSGNVGIGTTSPSARCDIFSSANVLTDVNSAASYHLRLQNPNNDTGEAVGLCFGLSDGGDIGASIYHERKGSNSYGDLIFATKPNAGSNQERARIDSSGRLLVGTSSAISTDTTFESTVTSGNNHSWLNSGDLNDGDQAYVAARGEVNNANSRIARIGVIKNSGNTNACGYLFLDEEDGDNAFFWTDNSGNFRISSNSANIGTTSGTVVGTQTSDERIKNILGPVEYGLDTIKQVEPVRYSLKSEPKTEKLGFIAQQMLPLVPESVFDTDEMIEEGEPTKLGMEYVALIPVLVNAIKELSAEVDSLKAQLQAL